MNTNSHSKKENEGKQEIREKELEPFKILLFKSQDFLSDLDVAREMFETIVPILVEKNNENKDHVDQILNEITSKIKESEDGEDENTVTISSVDLQRLKKGVSRINKAVTMFRQQSIVLLVTKLDEFVTELLRIALAEQPNKLKGSDKAINYDQIFKYDNINDMIKDIIASEIDSLMRKSHAVSISFLDESFKLGIVENISGWSTFIELTQRRNLFVHSGGKINSQYLENCKKYGIPIENELKVGSSISVDQEYFQKAFMILYELGVRLSQALYRRLFPSNLDMANTILNEIGFDLMVEERWKIADSVFGFAREIPDKLIGSSEDKLRFIINSAICKKRLGEDKQFNQLINSVDWSAYKSTFRLAVSVLEEDYEKASKLMKNIDLKDINEHGYKTWPLFEKFRDSKLFKNAYKEKFGTEFDKDVTKEEILEPEDEE